MKNIVEVRPTNAPSFSKRKRTNGAQKAGLAYEKEVHEHFEKTYPDSYIRSPWFAVRQEDKYQFRLIQPDALHINWSTGVITIVEIKIRHTVRAWWQLRQRYEPALQLYFGRDLEVCEVFRWNNPKEELPEAAQWVTDFNTSTSRYKLFSLK